MQLIEIDKNEILLNPFTKLDKQWFLLTAGDISDYNTMTASWGALGTVWGKSAVTAYVRHSRKTFELMEKSDYFTVSFFDQQYRNALSFCGKYSGRDCDKAAQCGLTPVKIENGVSFEQAQLVILCKKMYSNDFDLSRITSEAAKGCYNNDAVHREYIGEVLKIFEIKR